MHWWKSICFLQATFVAFFPTASASVCQISLMQSGSFSNACRDPSGSKWGAEMTQSLWPGWRERAVSTADGRTQEGGRRLETRKKWEGASGRRWNGGKGSKMWHTRENWERWKVWEGLARAGGGRKGSGRQRENQPSPTGAPTPWKSEGRCSIPAVSATLRPPASLCYLLPPEEIQTCTPSCHPPLCQAWAKEDLDSQKETARSLGLSNSPTEETAAVSSGNLFPSRQANGVKRSALTPVHLECKRDLGGHSALSCNDTGTM